MLIDQFQIAACLHCRLLSALFCLMLQVAEIKALQRVATQNMVAINILHQSMQQDQELQGVQTTWDFSHHPSYPSIRVKHASKSSKQ